MLEQKLFKVTMITLLRTLREKVDNTKYPKGNNSSEMEAQEGTERKF